MSSAAAEEERATAEEELAVVMEEPAVVMQASDTAGPVASRGWMAQSNEVNCFYWKKNQ